MNRRIFVLLAALAAFWPVLALAQEETNVNDSGSAFDALLNMSPISAYMLLCGMALPFLIAAINRRTWSSTAKLACTVVVCTLASLGWFVFHGDIVPVGKWLRLSLLILVGATLMYHLFRPAVKQVEAKTG